MEVGEKIKKARKAKGLTQEQLGELVGFQSQSPIAQWELGIRIPKLETIVKISRALQINPLELLPDWFIDEVNQCS